MFLLVAELAAVLVFMAKDLMALEALEQSEMELVLILLL